MILWTLTHFLTQLSLKILVIMNIEFCKSLTCSRSPVDMIFGNTNIVRLFLLHNKKDTCVSSSVLNEHHEQQHFETGEILACVEGVYLSGFWTCFFFHEKSSIVKEY